MTRKFVKRSKFFFAKHQASLLQALYSLTMLKKVTKYIRNGSRNGLTSCWQTALSHSLKRLIHLCSILKIEYYFVVTHQHDSQNTFVRSFRIIFMKGKAYDTGSSQAVPHPSTIPARRCLTSVIGRERVFSSWYGRRHLFERYFSILLPICFVSKVNHKWF